MSNLTSLNSIASVTSLKQLKLDADGGLEKRSTLNTLGHRIMDAFRCLSSSGRTAVITRNGELLAAMQKAVNEQQGNDGGAIGEARAKLSKTLEALYDKPHHQWYYANHLTKTIMSDPSIATQSERNALAEAFSRLAPSVRAADLQNALNVLKARFCGQHNMEEAVTRMRMTHQAIFTPDQDIINVSNTWDGRINGAMSIKPTDWSNIESTIDQHLSDIEKANIKTLEFQLSEIVMQEFNIICQTGLGENAGSDLLDKLKETSQNIRSKLENKIDAAGTKLGADASAIEHVKTASKNILAALTSDEALTKKVEEAELLRGISNGFLIDVKRGMVTSIDNIKMASGKDCANAINALRKAVGPEHAKFLPFISTMLSQWGIGKAGQNIQEACGLKEQDLMKYDVIPKYANPEIAVKREDNDLVIRFSNHCNYLKADGSVLPILHSHATLTMRIHLDQPEAASIEQKIGTAYIPSVTYEDASLTYSTPPLN